MSHNTDGPPKASETLAHYRALICCLNKSLTLADA
jgi:hypothetical protein